MTNKSGLWKVATNGGWPLNRWPLYRGRTVVNNAIHIRLRKLLPIHVPDANMIIYVKANYFPVDYRLVVVGELVCLNDLESYTVGGLPPAGLTLAGRSKGRGQTKW